MPIIKSGIHSHNMTLASRYILELPGPLVHLLHSSNVLILRKERCIMVFFAGPKNAALPRATSAARRRLGLASCIFDVLVTEPGLSPFTFAARAASTNCHSQCQHCICRLFPRPASRRADVYGALPFMAPPAPPLSALTADMTATTVSNGAVA